jgi:Asp-tRNA(Asn)/Glu-tRNA(Gln) amidotransferase A subunit family amidase
VPVGVKDIFDTADMPTENGSPLHAGRTPSRDAAVVAMLRAAGAVIMGKTVTTEFAYFSPGKTCNPHNVEHTPGGSSSGSAAAVAASMVPIALGSQTNGSTIRPAAYCGVIGFKPTHGLIPRQGVLTLSRTLDHVGLFSRTLEDIALLAEQLVGYNEADPDTRPRAHIPFIQAAAEEPPLPPTFGFVKTPYWERVDEDTKEGFAELIEQLGGQIEEIEFLPSAIDAWELHRTIMEAEMAANLEREWGRGCDRLSEQLRAQLERGRKVLAVDYQRALSRIAPVYRSFAELFEQRYDAILTPAERPFLDRRPAILHLVDTLRYARDQLAASAERQRIATGCPAHRPTPRRRPPSAHSPLARGKSRGGLEITGFEAASDKSN